MKQSTTALATRSAGSAKADTKKIALKGCPTVGNKLYPWTPLGARSHMGNPMKESILGLSVLSALSIAGIHSAVNPSYFTLRSFAAQPQAKAAAREGLWIGLALGIAGSAGVGLVFDEWTPAIVSGLVALGLFGVGLYAVNSPPISTMPPIEQQKVTQEVSV